MFKRLWKNYHYRIDSRNLEKINCVGFFDLVGCHVISVAKVIAIDNPHQ